MGNMFDTAYLFGIMLAAAFRVVFRFVRELCSASDKAKNERRVIH
jgi:predicted outer membrane lipoprotein